jgi:hypothetical protein
MNWIIERIKEPLDGLAEELFSRGRPTTTVLIHDEIERLAPLYASTAGFAFTDDYPEAAGENSDRTLLVFRETRGLPRVFRSSLGSFLYDHCWLTYYNHNASIFNKTDEPLAGYLSTCEFVMEVELERSENVPLSKQDASYWDFAKLS